MIKNSKLQKFLKEYSEDADVVTFGLEDGEIKHVGMASTKDGKYKVVLASQKPNWCCKKCGENVYHTKTASGYPFFCVHCNKPKGLGEVERI